MEVLQCTLLGQVHILAVPPSIVAIPFSGHSLQYPLWFYGPLILQSHWGWGVGLTGCIKRKSTKLEHLPVACAKCHLRYVWARVGKACRLRHCGWCTTAMWWLTQELVALVACSCESKWSLIGISSSDEGLYTCLLHRDLFCYYNVLNTSSELCANTSCKYFRETKQFSGSFWGILNVTRFVYVLLLPEMLKSSTYTSKILPLAFNYTVWEGDNMLD